MNIMTHKIKQNENLFCTLENLAPELLNNFTTYWKIRKSSSHEAAYSIQLLSNPDAGLWIRLIESNQKFRDQFGEEMAERLIRLIES